LIGIMTRDSESIFIRKTSRYRSLAVTGGLSFGESGDQQLRAGEGERASRSIEKHRLTCAREANLIIRLDRSQESAARRRREVAIAICRPARSRACARIIADLPSFAMVLLASPCSERVHYTSATGNYKPYACIGRKMETVRFSRLIMTLSRWNDPAEWQLCGSKS